MAWETRRRKSYLYTKERIGNRVVSRYVGSGATAELIDRFSALRRQEADALRAEQQARRVAEVEEMTKADEEADELFATVDSLMKEALMAAGFHQHKRGEWRRKRCQPKDSSRL